jgi:hypothetical protein
LFHFQQVELTLKLFMMPEDTDSKKKKKSKKRFCKINRMVDDHLKQSIPEFSKEHQIKRKPPNKKKTQTCYSSEKPIPDVRDSVRQHLSKKTSANGCTTSGHTAGRPKNGNISPSFSGKTVQAQREVRMRKPLLQSTCGGPQERNLSHTTTILSRHLMQQDKNNDAQLELKEQQEQEQVIEMSQEQCNILLQLFENHQNGNESVASKDFSVQSDFPAQEESLSPVTSTSNMLERLLRRSESSYPESFLSSGLEESTGSMPGLR